MATVRGARRWIPPPADLRNLSGHLGSPLPWSQLAQRIDPQPDTVEGRRANGCNQDLRRAFERERFAWNVRRGTLFEILVFLEGVQHYGAQKTDDGPTSTRD